MARLRRPPYLICFYCGQRTSTRNDGSVHHFECPRCDATNYLDENGDITDPPVATTTTAETNRPRFASPPDPFPDSSFASGGSAGSSSENTVFCKTCLKNQHLFISSLAQYFPSDPNHPDTPELERRYFRFRQGLEQRYPQVCADCEPRVIERIRAAGYTAKTDHLRRMVDYSRQVRLTRPTYLDAADRLGRWLWWGGLLLQFLWQAGVLGSFLFVAASGSAGDVGFGDDAVVEGSAPSSSHASFSEPTFAAVPFLLQPVLRQLAPNANRLQSLCITATLAGCWWNPHFVQTVRGFTKPFVGISTWYAYQAAIVFVRIALAKVAGQAAALTSGTTASTLPPTIVGSHVAAALFMIYLYARAPRSIRKDLRPLFGKLPETPLTPQRSSQTAEQKAAENRRRGLETMSDVLDEISTTPALPSSPLQRRDSDTDGWDGWRPSQVQNRFSTSPIANRLNGGSSYGGGPRRADDNFALGSLQISEYDNEPASHSPLTLSQERDQYYAEEMDIDWTPTQSTQPQSTQPQSQNKSPHRAFESYEPSLGRFGQQPSPSALGSFSQTPVEANRGPFWYKVPPAPTSIAQRIFNRPNAPRLLQQTGAESKDNAGSATAFFGQDSGLSGTLNLGARGGAASSSSVEFAQPSFFAEDIKRRTGGGGGGGGGSPDDPGSFLSDLFSQAFTLNTGRGEEETEELSASGDVRTQRRISAHGGRFSVTASLPPQGLVRLVLLLASSTLIYLLGTDLHDVHDSIGTLAGLRPYFRLLETAAIGLCATMAVSLTGESVHRWNYIIALRQMQVERRTGGSVASSSSLLPSSLGILLGLAGLAQAGWMAFQMYTLLSSDGARQGYEAKTPGLASPWQWLQVAWLHGTVVVHQAWNILVR